MSIGIVLKGMNSLHFRNKLDFFFEFIPQILLLFALFGWMDILILGKWINKKNIEDVTLPGCPTTGDIEKDFLRFNEVHLSPAIISTMIDIFLNGASNELKNPVTCPGIKTSVEYNYVVGGQKALSIIFLLIAFACVPVMLMVKPLILKKRMALEHGEAGHGVEIKSEKILYEGSNSKLLGDEKMDQIAEIIKNEGSHDGAHSFGDIMIHQLIETIEFVLGTVSNTASYLRLWALSLAHSQLAAVFLELLLVKYAFEPEDFFGSTISLFLLFFAFFSITFGVLMCMDTMECFLHTLRLHWVEFQNKFYKGNGYKYSPYSFTTVLKNEMRR
jgi:V-type H+-transporting ATPase subunit a